MVIQICYHYKYRLDYVENLDAHSFSLLAKGLQQMKAQETLEDFTVVSYPNMAREGKSKLHKEVFKSAFPDVQKKQVTGSDIKRLGLKGISKL